MHGLTPSGHKRLTLTTLLSLRQSSSARGILPRLPFHYDPIQHPRSPSEGISLHMRIGLRCESDIRVSSQFLHHERIFGLLSENLFAPGLRLSVTSCHKLSLPVYLREGLTG